MLIVVSRQLGIVSAVQILTVYKKAQAALQLRLLNFVALLYYPIEGVILRRSKAPTWESSAERRKAVQWKFVVKILDLPSSFRSDCVF